MNHKSWGNGSCYFIRVFRVFKLSYFDDCLNVFFFQVVLRQSLSVGAFIQKTQQLCGVVLNSNQDFEFSDKELQLKENLPAEVNSLVRVSTASILFQSHLQQTNFNLIFNCSNS